MKGNMTKNKPCNEIEKVDGLEQYLTVPEVSKKLCLAESSVYNFIHRGVFPATKIGRAVRLRATEVNEALAKLRRRTIGIAA
jgi:excisionase family DNA binding protein